MLTHWQEPIFDRVAQRLPFIQSQPLSTFSLACILGDATYVFNAKIGSLFDLGLGAIHPGYILTVGGIAALIGHVFLLASADQVDGAGEHGPITAVLSHCRRVARLLTLGWRPSNPFLLGFAALSFNGLALTLDAMFEMLIFGANAAMAIQLIDGIIVMGGLGAAMASRLVRPQPLRDKLNAFAPKLLAYGTFLTVVLGLLAVAPFMLLGGLLFVVGNSAQHHYAMRLRHLENQTQTSAAA